MSGEPLPLPVSTEFDLRLQLPNHALFVGPSMSGKTRLALSLLEQAPNCLHPVPDSVHIFYDQWQEQYRTTQTRLEAMGVEVKISPGGGSLTLSDFPPATPHRHTLVLIDDAGDETAASSEIARIFTNGRHKNLSLWLLWHTLFSKHPPGRTIAQNAAYQFFLPGPRLGSQIHSLDTQLAYHGDLSAAYRVTLEEVNWTRRHLLLDLTPTTPEAFRLRSQVSDPHIQLIFLRRFSST